MTIAASILLSGCGSGPDKDAEPVVSVATAKVTRSDVNQWVDEYAMVTATPPGSGSAGGAARLAAPEATVVRALAVREGQEVQAGALIARLDDQVAGAQLAQARTEFNAAGEREQRQSKLFAIGGIARETLDETRAQVASSQAGIATASAALARTRVSAPISGKIARLYVVPGQAIAAGAPIADVVNGQRLSLTGMVPIDDAAGMRSGQPVTVSGTNGSTYSGTLEYVAPEADPSTGSVVVRATVPATGLIQGQAVTLKVLTGRHEQVLTVPQSALYTDHDGKTTLAIVRGGKAHVLAVHRGFADGDRIEVSGPGLSAGQTVITTGSYALAEGTRVKADGSVAQPSNQP